jgi:hypothetical protein
MKLQGATVSNDVYLFARVFSSGGSGMGLKLYLDSATLRQDGGLVFKTDGYSVTPGHRT